MPTITKFVQRRLNGDEEALEIEVHKPALTQIEPPRPSLTAQLLGEFA